MVFPCLFFSHRAWCRTSLYFFVRSICLLFFSPPRALFFFLLLSPHQPSNPPTLPPAFLRHIFWWLLFLVAFPPRGTCSYHPSLLVRPQHCLQKYSVVLDEKGDIHNTQTILLRTQFCFLSETLFLGGFFPALIRVLFLSTSGTYVKFSGEMSNPTRHPAHPVPYFLMNISCPLMYILAFYTTRSLSYTHCCSTKS